MIRRETDAAFINQIANSAGVREFIRADGEAMDFTPLIEAGQARSGCVVLSNGEDAVAIFEATADGIYQSHTMFAPTCRGRKAVETGKEMVAYMFKLGVDIVWGSTPRDNRKALWFNRQIGASEIGGDEEDVIFEIRKAA